MSYSRQQLYAMGEPFGECATRKEGGRIIYGGGGGGSSAPATQTQISDLPSWAKPTAERLLARTEALTDLKDNPYQAYKGKRVAEFSPLQRQAFQDAAEMHAGPAAFNQQVGKYMSPYIQNVIDQEKLEAARVSQLQGLQQQAQATQAGAFGGYREAIQRAERERGLGMQLQDIQTRGLQSAYDRAADQFRSGITQNLALNQARAQLGGIQQQREQSILSNQYQDFLNQQRYPYQQAEFMANIMRGTPMGTVSTLYGSQPNMAQQFGALGMGAYGLSKIFAEGGSVTSDDNVKGILNKLSDAQLQQAKQIALAQRDVERVQMIDAELAERASLKSGLGSAFNMLPQEEQDAVTEMAGGGIVAFAGGGYNPPDFAPMYESASRLSEELPSAVYTAPTQEETAAGIRAQRGLVQEMMGADKLNPFMAELAAKRSELKEGNERAKGFAALAAMEPMLKGRGLASIGAGVSKFGSELSRLEKENQDADRLLMASQVQIATAQQARADGQFDKANQLFRTGEELKEKGLAAKRDVLGRQATLQATMGGQALSAAGHKYSADTQAATSRDVANIHANVQREGFGKPGETERILAKMENILTGKESFGGKTGEEGVKLFQAYRAQEGAARMGVGEGGERPATAPNAAAVSSAVSSAMRSDPEAKRITAAMETIELQMSSYARKGKPVPPELSARLKTLQDQKDALRQQFEAEIRGRQSGASRSAAPASAATTAAARPTLEAFLPAARAANPGVSDAELTAYYERTYGRQ